MLEHNEQTKKWDYKNPPDVLSGMMDTLKASATPVEHLKLIVYPNQPANKRMYMPGYESYFNMLPVLNPGETDVTEKFNRSRTIVSSLADVLVKQPWVLNEPVPAGEFHRHIIAMEAPELVSMYGDYEPFIGSKDVVPGGAVRVEREGKELVVAHWGNGFVSPVHGHLAGLEVEEMLAGKLIVNRYRMISTDTVRLVSSVLYEGRKTIEFAYTIAQPGDLKRQQLIHNFISVGNSVSLHYVPEHTRDGRDNSFKVQYFEEMYYLTEENTTRISVDQALKLKPGSVMLVRSANVPEYGDHFVVITGGLVVKPHGIRQKDTTIKTHYKMPILDGHGTFDSHHESDTVLLLLNEETTEDFLEFHDIQIETVGQHSFDDAYDLRYDQVKPITTEQAMHLRRTDVLLVRSKALPEMGDHYVVVTGHAVQKDHGMRPQTAVFPAMQNSPLLDMFDGPGNNVVLLKLNNEATQEFLNHYQMHLDEALNVVSETTKLELV